jgi:HEAT repeat protein
VATRVAFLIANQTFRPDSDLLPLQGPGNDMAALSHLLRDPERGKFEVREFLDKSHHEVLPELEQALGNAVLGDLFFIYYSGHGKLARNGHLCLATADTRQDALRSTSIPARHLRDLVEESNCDQVVLLLDCCYSGAVDDGLRGDVGSELEIVDDAHGFYIVTASTGMQAARETAVSPNGVVMGRFTAALVNGIQSGAADRERKGKILLSDLRRYLGQVDTGSTPLFFERRASGDPLISLSPATAAPLPGDRMRRLVETLQDSDQNVRRSAIDALGNIGPNAAGAAPALAAALKDPDKHVRQRAAGALVTIGPNAAEAVPALAAALKDHDNDVRRLAALALGKIGPNAAEAEPALADTLKDPDTIVRLWAIEALGKIGPAAVPALAAALIDADKDVRARAAAALAEIGPNATEAVAALAAILKDPDATVRWDAAYVLSRIGPNAAEAVPALVDTLKDPDKDVRLRTAGALGRIGPNAAEAVPTLVGTLKDPDKDVRARTASALGQIGPDAREALPALAAALKDPDQNVRARAAWALQRIQATRSQT